MLATMPRKSRKSAVPQAALHQHKNHKVPNLYWRSVSTDSLRRNERFMGLPPVAHLEQPSQPPNHRYVRQESALWRQLHHGLLTTGLAKAALGLHDPKQAQVVGIHPGSRGSSHLLSAYFHLLAASSSSSSGGGGGGGAAAAAAANEASRQQYNQPAAVAARAAAVAPSVEELQATCERTALAGDLAVKLAWGKVQEGAALFALLQLFPDALLEEVGLFQVHLGQLPPSWRPELNASTLPGLGASPDGLILHRVTLSAADLQAAAATLQQQEQQLAQGQQQGQQQQQGQEVPGLSLHILQQQAVQGLLRAALDRVVCTGQRPRVGVPLASSSDDEEPRQEQAASEEEEDSASDDRDGTAAGAGQEAAASSSSSSNSSTSSGDDAGFIAASLGLQQLSLAEEEAGGSSNSSSNSGGSSGLPAERGVMPTAEEAGGLVFEPVAAALLGLLGRQPQWGSSSSRVATATGGGAAASSSSSVDCQQAVAACEPGADITLHVREVLEVKNHCPFQFRSKTRGKKGRVNVAFGFRARGPAQRLQAQWVPQLQLHMLATGCESALLASRCPHVGMRVFRLWRDDFYIFSMLQVLSLLQTQHVHSGVPPKADAFSKLPGYRAFVHRTAKLARAAVCIAAVGEEGMHVPAAADGSNVHKFWID